MKAFWQDLCYGARMLGKRPGFTVVAVFTLALGFALSATTLAVVNAYLIRSLPYPAAQRLYRVIYAPVGQREPGNLAALDWRSLSDVVEVADNSAPSGGFYLTEGGSPQEVRGLQAGRGSLEALGVRVTLGRSLRDEDFHTGAEPVALLGQSLWQELFGADPNIIGRQFPLRRGNATEPPEMLRIVGVLPPEFRYVREYAREAVEFVTPLRVPRQTYMVRLREGVPVALAERRITEAIRSFASSFPPNWGGVRLESIQAAYVRELRPVLLAITVAAGLVLVIVCVNVAVLVLLRALRRQKEMAVRVALGAGRKHIISILVAEASLICGAALVAGLALTGFTLRLLAPIIEERLRRPIPGGASALTIDSTVLLSIGGVGVLVALSLAFIPLLTPWERRLADVLRREGRSGTDGPGMRRFRSALIALEVAASLALLVGCGLMIRTVVHLVRTDLGYQTVHMVRARASLPPRTYPDEAACLRFYDRFTERLTALPHEPFALTNFIPFYEYPPQEFEVDGAASDKPSANVMAVNESYFGLFGIQLRQGRGFTAGDRLGAEPVAVISETLARRLWPDGGALGRRIRTSEQTSLGAPLTVWRTIVGVAADVRQTHTDTDLRDVYLSFAQAPSRFGHLYLRTERPPSGWFEQLRALAKEIDPQVMISGRLTEGNSLQDQAERLLAGPKFLMSLLTGFALFAALLAIIGIYGVTAYAVQQREREVAIRSALGATPGAIIRMFLKDGGLVLAIGIGGGLGGAVAVARMLANQLYGVQPFDVTTLLGACAFMAAAGLLATWWPARRAAARNPIASLNEN
jgi:putative ABC transport system permease protein